MEDNKKKPEHTISSHELNRSFNGEPSWVVNGSEKVGTKSKMPQKL